MLSYFELFNRQKNLNTSHMVHCNHVKLDQFWLMNTQATTHIVYVSNFMYFLLCLSNRLTSEPKRNNDYQTNWHQNQKGIVTVWVLSHSERELDLFIYFRHLSAICLSLPIFLESRSPDCVSHHRCVLADMSHQNFRTNTNIGPS